MDLSAYILVSNKVLVRDVQKHSVSSILKGLRFVSNAGGKVKDLQAFKNMVMSRKRTEVSYRLLNLQTGFSFV